MTIAERIKMVLPRRANVINDDLGTRAVCFEEGDPQIAARCDGPLPECEAFARAWMA